MTRTISDREKDDQVAMFQRIFGAGKFRAILSGQTNVGNSPGFGAIAHWDNLGDWQGGIPSAGKRKGSPGKSG